MTQGRILALNIMLASRCGYSADLSGPVNDRALCHLDNAYFLEHVDVISHRCKTHTVSNTAFRGFGGPQGMMVIERISMTSRARSVSIRSRCGARTSTAIDERNVTHYGQVDRGQCHCRRSSTRLAERSGLRRAARARSRQWNAANAIIKRGFALTPVKFGISFNATLYNQAGALVHVYTDGTVLLNHGGTEMGQGLHTKVAQVVATEFGLPLSAIRVTTTDTSQGAEHLGDGSIVGRGSQWQGGAGGGTDDSTSG